MHNRSKVLMILITLALASLLLMPQTFAEGKNGLAHIVEEHAKKIAAIEKILSSLEKPAEGADQLSEEVKQALLKEAKNVYDSMYELNESDGRAVLVTHSEIIEENGSVILRIYTEGEYNWTYTADNSSEGTGRSFARGFSSNYDRLARMYGVNIIYEFYANGERVKTFID